MSIQDIVLTVLDQNSDPIEGVSVELRHDSDDSVLTTGYTDSGGEVTVPSVESGTYYALGYKSLLTFDRQVVEVAVSGLLVPPDQLFTLVASVFSITEPSAPLLCKVYGFLSPSVLYSISGMLTGVVVSEEEHTGIGSGGTSFVERNQQFLSFRSTVKREGGVWEADLRQGTVATVEIPSIKYRKRFRVPNSTSANIEDQPSMRESADLVPST